jgi:hypothetical protein
MGSQTAVAIQEMSTKVTLLGGFCTWASANSNVLTLFIFACTGLASIIYGLMNARANKERNRINRRDITDSIMNDLKHSGKNTEYITDLMDNIRN